MRQLLFSVFTTLLAVANAQAASPDDSKVQTRLLLDDRIIESADNAKLTVGEVRKHKSNPLFGEDKPWEDRFDNFYGNVIYDEDDQLFKCWYCPFIVDHSAKGMSLQERDSKRYQPPRNREMGVCYAISRDGVEWKKPELDIVEYDGSTKNNIVYRMPHGSGVFKDARETDPARRFKMFTRDGNGVELAVSFSPDGIHWSELLICPEIHPAPIDGTHYNALWVPELRQYVGFTRLRGVGNGEEPMEPDGKNRKIRQVGRTASKDFLKWTKHELLWEGLSDHLQIYAMPVFRHGGVYLGLPVIYDIETDRAWTELAWSADTKDWHRVDPGNPLIPCSDKKLDYDYGCVYACAYPIFLADEIRLYYGGSDYLHFGWRNGSFCLATLRQDGFAGYEPKSNDAPAVITTKLLSGNFASLSISADVQDGGSVSVTVLDQQGKQLAFGKPVDHTVTDGQIVWEGGGKSFAGRSDGTRRLKFMLKKAKLYSCSFLGE
ncbi:hypothetical protein OAS39_08775 [Pirellulales bacterium]|nr:hypothetical protein [Pirellulales bacterium]